MIIPDVNLLVYAYELPVGVARSGREMVDFVFIRGAPVGIPWVVALGFVRL